MTLTTVADYKQEEFNTSFKYWKNVPTKCVKETYSYRLVHIFEVKTMIEVLTNQKNRHNYKPVIAEKSPSKSEELCQME